MNYTNLQGQVANVKPHYQPSAQSLRLIILLILVMGVAPSPALTAGCPARCICDDQLVVQCAGQHLTAFPNDLPLATRQLIISNNRIVELPPLQLNYLSDLVYLDCSNNSLTEISMSTFGNLGKLAYLDLSFNTLTRIEDRTFGPLSSLVMLRMTDNPGLSDIHPDAFAKNSALQVLDVSRNNLTVLNISSLIALPTLRSVGLSGNSWSCDCDNEDLCLWVHIEAFKFQDEGQTVCRGPPDLQGQRLGELGLQLRSRCHQGLGFWDYLFFLVIGFVIFAAGTVSAWAIGVVMVLYERYVKKKSEQMDPDDEIEQDAGPGTGAEGVTMPTHESTPGEPEQLAYGAVRGTAPQYLQALIRPYTQTRALRSSTSGLLASLPLRKYSSRSAQSKLFAALAPNGGTNALTTPGQRSQSPPSGDT